jgi:2-iminobutanoate/2-iminopropanoate deaminase
MHQRIETSNSPAPVGPYSQAIIASGAFMFISGQVALDPQTGKLIGDGDVTKETKQVLKNIEEILKTCDLKLADIVKSTVFLDNINDFSAVNSIYAEAFSCGIPPARSCFEVSKLPLGAKVEIECIALLRS